MGPVEMPSEAAEKVAKPGAIEAGQPPTAGKEAATKNADRNVINEDGLSLSSAADNEEAPLEAPEDAENEEVMNNPEAHHEEVQESSRANEEANAMTSTGRTNPADEAKKNE